MLEEVRVRLGQEALRARQVQHEHAGAIRSLTKVCDGILEELSADVDRRADLPETEDAHLPMEQARAVREMLEALDDRLREEIMRLRAAHARAEGYAEGLESGLGITTALAAPAALPAGIEDLAVPPGT